MKKKLLSLLMATAMILSLAVPAFAASGSIWYQEESESNNTEQRVTMPSKMFIPTVKLTMPKIDGEPFVLNPYKIAYEVGGTNKVNNVAVTVAANGSRQVICPIYDIKSETNADMTFSVNVKATLAGEVTLTPNPVPITETQPTTKQAHLLFVYTKNSTSTAPAISSEAAIVDLDEFDKANNDALTLVAGETGVTTPVSSSTLLKAATVSSGTTTPEYLSFQIKGDLTRNPKTAWKEADKVTGTIVFTFTPVSKPDYTGTVDGAAKTVAFQDDSVSGDYTFTLPQLTSSMTVDKKSLAAVPTSVTGPAFTVKAGNDAAYTVFNKGALNPTVTAEGGVTIPADALKTLPTNGTDTNYKFTVAFADKNGVPRTLEVTVPINRAAS